jgi:hypothetical protein
VVLVIIVVVAWIAILSPSVMKRRSRSGGEIGSISHFHQQLRVLEHSAPPPIVAPAYRLRAVDGSGDPAPGPGCAGGDQMPVLTVVGADRLPRPALAFLGERSPEESDRAIPAHPSPLPHARDRWRDPPAASSAGDALGIPTRAIDPVARRLVRRRRRDTLGVLTMVCFGTVMIGFVPGAGVAWIVAALSGAALVAYVALLVHLRRMAEERGQKLRYLRPAGRGELDVDGTARMPVAVGGRYAHPSNQAVAAH